MDIALIGNTLLRSAIQQNLVSFPSQVPALMRRQGADTLERVVQLYFLRGWPVRRICRRYRLSKAMVQKLLSEWRIRAVAAGYIQDIHPEDLEALRRAYEEQMIDESDEYEGSAAEIAFDAGTSVWAPALQPRGEHALSVREGL
jgi:hypothetical protein